MLADRCVLQPGVTIEKLAVLGSGSVGKAGCRYPVGSVWVGSKSNGAVMLCPEDNGLQSSSTITPFGKAFYLRMASYFVLPLPMVVAYNILAASIRVVVDTTPLILTILIAHTIYRSSWGSELALVIGSNAAALYVVLVAVSILVNAAMVFTIFAYELALKRCTVGHRRPGEYPWDKSPYCQRWQIYLSFNLRNFTGEWAGALELIQVQTFSIDFAKLTHVQGSAYLVWFFRVLGCTIGTNVCLYPFGAGALHPRYSVHHLCAVADPMMTEPELVTLGDHCSIDDCSLVAHINTRLLSERDQSVIN
jgi:hypothetical protein